MGSIVCGRIFMVTVSFFLILSSRLRLLLLFPFLVFLFLLSTVVSRFVLALPGNSSFVGPVVVTSDVVPISCIPVFPPSSLFTYFVHLTMSDSLSDVAPKYCAKARMTSNLSAILVSLVLKHFAKASMANNVRIIMIVMS